MASPVRTVISPARYVQGKGAIHQIGEYLKPIGSTPLFVADDLVWGLVGHDIEASLKNAGLPAQRESFGGIPSAKEIDRLVEVIKASGADVAVAVGGGSAIDAVKAAGFLAGIRWANCPTVASTDAPCSALSVIYTEDGEFEEYRFFPRNPDLVLVYESGTIGAKPHRVPLSIGDGELAETADLVVAVPEMFNYWIGAGRIQVAFLGAAQVDRHGNLNSTVIGDYDHPRTRLPGAGGAPEIATGCREVVVIAPHSTRTFVERLDFLTTTGARTTQVITDLGVLEPRDGELTLTATHRGVTVDEIQGATGWTLRVADDLTITEAPSDEELGALRELVSR